MNDPRKSAIVMRMTFDKYSLKLRIRSQSEPTNKNKNPKNGT